MSYFSIFGIPFQPITKTSVISEIEKLLADGRQHLVATPNSEMLLESLKNEQLRAVLQETSLNLPDGIGVLWAAKFLSLPKRGKLRTFVQWKLSLLSVLFYPKYCRSILPERVTGVDSMQTICTLSEQKKYSVFLLGGKENVAEQAKNKLVEKLSGIQVVGTYAGRPFTEDDQIIVEKINQAGPKILFVAFGSPKQELWIRENLSKLPSVKLAMGIGGAFDFIAGHIKRAPVFFQRLGLEWLWRLFQEPRKRFKRIWKAVVIFPIKVLKYKLMTVHHRMPNSKH